MPVYNGARFLRRSLDALLGQSYRDFELVISDNASTDSTPQIISEYAARDSRVRYLRAAVNAGVEANFRRVLSESSGRYFMWAGCDDWWAPTFVERVVSALERDRGAVVAMSDVEREGSLTHDAWAPGDVAGRGATSSSVRLRSVPRRGSTPCIHRVRSGRCR
jgi:glycosyltransferase involved in cell wall biosynthesis